MKTLWKPVGLLLLLVVLFVLTLAGLSKAEIILADTTGNIQYYIGWNLLLIAAFVIRIADKFLNKDIPFSFNREKKEAFHNLKIEVYAFMCMLLALSISLFKPLPTEWNDWTQILLYLTIGFGANYFFSKTIEYGTNFVNNLFKDKTGDK